MIDDKPIREEMEELGKMSEFQQLIRLRRD